MDLLDTRRPRALLLAFCLLVWLPGFFTLPPTDRDESRFAQASKQMIETGDYVRIMNGTSRATASRSASTGCRCRSPRPRGAARGEREPDLAVPPAVAGGRAAGGAGDLRDRAGDGRPPGGAAGGRHAGGQRGPDGRDAHGQDGRGPARRHDGRDGGAGAGLCRAAGRAGAGGAVLAGDGRRDPAERADHADGGRAGGGDAGRRGPPGALAAGAAAG